MDRTMQLAAFVSSTRFKFMHPDVGVNNTQMKLNGGQEPVLVLSYSDFVGWVRFEGRAAVWRYGSLRTGRASAPQFVGDLNQDEGAVVVNAISHGVHEVGAEWPPADPADPADGEPEEFIRRIENQQTPLSWSRAIPGIVPEASRPVAVMPARAEPVSAKFNSYPHTSERHPAAPGFTEEQLNNVPLITVHPGTAPAAVGAVFLLLAFLGGPYEL